MAETCFGGRFSMATFLRRSDRILVGAGAQGLSRSSGSEKLSTREFSRPHDFATRLVRGVTLRGMVQLGLCGTKRSTWSRMFERIVRVKKRTGILTAASPRKLTILLSS